MATGMHMDERSVDCLVLGHHDQDRKVSAKSVTMRAMTLCKNLSGYRELLLITFLLMTIFKEYFCHCPSLNKIDDLMMSNSKHGILNIAKFIVHASQLRIEKIANN